MRQTKDIPPVPIRWRPGPPAVSRGTLYQFVREFLSEQGGACLREQLRDAIDSDEKMMRRLAEGQGFGRLLVNMRHSGEIELIGDEVRATPRALRWGTLDLPANRTRHEG